MFVQDHVSDFEAVMAAKKPFALIRFGDGEKALLDGIEHKSADDWAVRGPSWLRSELLSSLCTDLDSFCIGLPPPCCLSRGLGLRAAVRVPLHHQTFATLFMHGNLPRVYELRERFKDAVIVSGHYGDIRVPPDGVSTTFDVDAVVEQMLAVTDKPILMAAGPLSNLLAVRYWKRQEIRLRVPCIDIGSTLDVLHGRINRHYHGKKNDHHCYWHEQSREIPQRPGKEHIHKASGDRVKIGRQQPTKEAQKIQRGPQRLRLGKR